MRNKYLLLGAASALMLAACSEDIKGPDSVRPAEDGLNLTSLSPASQSGRVSLPGETRGQKADRLQLVAKIAPIAGSDAAAHHWSATGIAISGGTAYVSWHSNHQASENPGVSHPADAWGGALDAISINALVNGQKDGVITNTQTSSRVKFNNVVAAGTKLYFPLTCYNNGAVIGRLTPGLQKMDTIGIPGSSANAIEVVGDKLYAVTGYAGGAYSMPVSFDEETKFDVVAPMDVDAPMKSDFGGKYIANGQVLRTDDTKAYLLPLNGGTERSLDMPLVSAEKYAEAYDPAKGEWYPLEGDKAAHYGKHTMAFAGNYVYVGAGKNGLRVYGTGITAVQDPDAVWSNNTNTTAVCVAEVNVAPEGQTPEKKNFIFAATGAGLRVYEAYDPKTKALPLYAFEVLNYNEDGTAAKGPNDNKPVAGTDAHSSNFVAVDSATGLIFVACGQSGVYVFRLNHQANPGKIAVSLKIPAINSEQTDEIEPDGEGKFIIPDDTPTPENEDEEFVGWSKDPNAKDPEYQAGDEVIVTPDVPNVTLYPVYKKKEQTAPTYNFTVKFDLERENTGATGTAPADIEFKDLEEPEYNLTMPVKGDIAREGFDFKGWCPIPNGNQQVGDDIFEAGNTYPFTEDMIFYPVWTKKVTQGGGEGGEGTDM